MSRFAIILGAAALALPLVAACGGDDADRRVIQVTQTDDGCTPDSIDLASGEKVKFEVANQGGRDKEFEGINGTKLDELLVPAGKTRNVNYTAPKSPGTTQIKCYIPGGATTLIALNVK
jgi:hypothetical protein